MKRILLADLVVTLGAIACTEFPNQPLVTVAIRQTAWPTEVFVTDTQTLMIQITLPNATRVTGLRARWQSSNDAVLRVAALEPPALASREDTLTAQLRAFVTARAGGFDTVSVVVEGGGAFEPVGVRYAIHVMQKWISLSVNRGRACGVTVGHDAFCWGAGGLGDGTNNPSSIPVPVIGGLKFRLITVGSNYTCGMLVDGRVYCWGAGFYGTLGNGASDDVLGPTPLALGRTFAWLVAGVEHACGMPSTSLWYCWGSNNEWQLGDAGLAGGAPRPSFDVCDVYGLRRCSLKPRPVRRRDFVPLELLGLGAGFNHTCAILVKRDTSEYLHPPLPVHTSGDAVCWGKGSAELGSDTMVTTDSTVPVPIITVPGDLKFKALATGDSHDCGITEPSSEAYCWGFNFVAQLGTNSTASTCPLLHGLPSPCSSTPLRVSGGHAFLALSAGVNSTCGLAADSSAYCWGENTNGELSSVARCGGSSPYVCATPVKVELPGNPKVVSISVTGGNGCAVTLRGAAYCWGGTTALGNDSIQGYANRLPPMRVSEPRAQ